MHLPELKNFFEFMPIPPVFYSSETGQPFSHCVACNRYLLEEGVQYVIEKAIKQYREYRTTDTIVEYAMCLKCYEDVAASFSETSRQNIENYFAARVDLVQRRHELLKDGRLNLDDWISSCVVKGTPVEELDEYQLVCQCDGGDLLFTYLPFLIGSAATEEVAQLLSAKTRGEIDGFYDRFFGPPPEIKRILDRPVFVF